MSGGGGELTTELPSFVDFAPIEAHSHFFGITKHELVPIIMSAVIIIFLCLFSILATIRLKKNTRKAAKPAGNYCGRT